MIKPIRKILVANRGEVVSRVIKTCQSMGIGTVAVFSTADQNAKFVNEADEAVLLGGLTSQESYLNIAKIILAARNTGCDAVHPGYGFLAENADFAEAVISAGLIFIGPQPNTIRKMGSKIGAKQIMIRAKVPVIPGYQGDNQQKNFLMEQAAKIGFPCLIKASAGGGGKGLKLVHAQKDLSQAIDSATREAKSAFNDEKLLIEKYLESAKHIEVQIFGDTQGNIVHLFERECSLQRRHQKVIEECPSAALTPSLRKKITKAAIKAAKAVNYIGAGTVEFILDNQGKFYFMEMNTRLQVEHSVTEMVTGLDLVKMQIDCAQGYPLPLKQKKITMKGHAMEVRIYAEDTQNGFLPATGKLSLLDLPSLPGIRYDMGISEGDDISIYYDPMIGKITAHAPTRANCIQKLAQALRKCRFLGIKTNVNFLLNLLEHPDHLGGRFDTGFIAKNAESLTKEHFLDGNARHHLIAATLCRHYKLCEDQTVSVQNHLAGFRNLPQSLYQKIMYQGKEYVICYTPIDAKTKQFEFRIEATPYSVQLHSLNSREIALIVNQHRIKLDYVLEASGIWLGTNCGSLKLEWVLENKNVSLKNGPGNHMAPLPGKVLKVMIARGQTVQTGETLMIVEAMKMEHAIKALTSGKIANIFFKENDTVKLGDLLVDLTVE